MSKKFQDIGTLLLTLGILILLNVVGSFLFQRFDLTTDNRYSLSEETKDLVSGLDDIVHFKVYLAGDLPPTMDRLNQATREMLDELRAYNAQEVHYEFIDPSHYESEKKRKRQYSTLREKGLREMILQVQKKGSRGEKLIFPGAIVSYKGKEVAMDLLEGKTRRPNPSTVNKAINNLEYKIGHTIRKLKRRKKPNVSFIYGHGELGKREVFNIVEDLSETYSVERTKIDGELDALEGKDAIIIAKPDSAFSDKDKFIIDQFVMNGGKVMWLVDPMNATMDSLQKSSTTMAVPNDLRIDDMLFSYGVRLNKDLVIDQNCAPLGIVTQEIKGRPRIERHDWPFYPTVSANGIDHPISSNIDPVRLRFASSIDTVSRDSVKHSILLNSSDNVRVLPSPTRVSLNMISIEPGYDRSNEEYVPLSVLMEGKFRSFFEGRIPPRIEKSEEIGFKKRSERTRMLVVGDGDVIRNHVDEEGNVYPLGYEKHQRRTIYGNKDFLLNGLEYLLAESDNTKLRSGVTLRKLDPAKTQGKDRYYWQVVNVSIPIALVLLFGIFQHYLRRRYYLKSAR